jgi:hypothetical protein
MENVFFRFQNRRMKHKKDTSNVKSVNRPTKPQTPTDDCTKIVKEKANSNDCHQDIVKRLMTHSQYFPANPNNKPVPVTYSNPQLSTYHHTPYSMNHQYQAYNHQMPPMYGSTQPFGNYCNKDFYYQQPQHQQPTYDQFANINTQPPSCLSPSLSSPSTHNNYDQISNGSPRNDYIFNGDFTMNFNADFDGFPLIDGAKTQQLFDHQAPVDMKSFEDSSSIAQLTQVKIESQSNDGIKNSFIDVKNNNALPNFSDDDVLSNASCSSRLSPSATVEWNGFANDGVSEKLSFKAF